MSSTLLNELKNYNHFWEAISIFIGVVFLFFLLKKQLHRRKIKYKDLLSLDLHQEIVEEKYDKNGNYLNVTTKKILKVDFQKDKAIFKKYNRKMAPSDFENIKEKLEHIWQERITEIESVKRTFGQNLIICHFERFKDLLTPKDLKPPSKYSFTIGLDGRGRQIDQDIKNDGEITLAIWGSKGSGKTVACKSIIRSFLEKAEHELIVFDFKVMDFIDLARENDSYLFNLSDDDELEAGYLYLKHRVDQHLEYKNKLLEQNVNSASWLDIKKTNKPKPFIILMDECQQYLSKKTIPRLTKDLDEEDKAKHRRLTLEKKLASLVDHIAAVHRAYGNCIILSSQDSRQGTYNISFSNFKTMLISQQNQAQSVALTGSTIATDKTLKKGKFLYLSDSVRKVQIPFSPNSPIPPDHKIKTIRNKSQLDRLLNQHSGVTQTQPPKEDQENELSSGWELEAMFDD